MSTENKNVVGKLDSATLARRLAKTKAVRDMERNRQDRRQRQEREESERKEVERLALEAGKNFMFSLMAEQASAAANALTAKQKEAERMAITRRKRGPGIKGAPYISRSEQSEAKKTAESLEALGFRQ